MSRGFAINLKLSEENDSLRRYIITAGGWDQPSPIKKVGIIEINNKEKTYSFVAEGDWEKEEFFLPSYTELLAPSPSLFEDNRINKSYGWWNMRLISALNRVLTKPEYKNRVWFYQ